jgi:UDP-N-acetylglucosamine 1-carboxyvinyltransferase
MDQFIINGGVKLEGEIEVLGVKNGVLPMIAASIMASKGTTIIHNVPALRDVTAMSKVVESLGAKVNYDPKTRTIVLDCQPINNYQAPYELVKQMRASFLVAGTLLGRFNKAGISFPGGCVIGARLVNMHLEAFQRLGASVTMDNGNIVVSTDGLKGTTYHFDFPTHTGTENVMMAACLAEGTTYLIGAACEPEIIDLANMLNKMGAKVSGAGTPHITIEGVKRLQGVEYTAIPSRIETGFLMAATAITGGEVIVKNAILGNLSIVVDKLRRMGVEITDLGDNRVLVKRKGRMKAVGFTTWPFPGFATDLQSSMMALLTVAEGTAVVKETVFENRFMHVNEMNRMGANIRCQLNEAVVTGVPHLTGTSVMSSDLQAGGALVIAALAAEGRSIIDRIYHVDRGYERLEERLSKIGASIERFNPVSN